MLLVAPGTRSVGRAPRRTNSGPEERNPPAGPEPSMRLPLLSGPAHRSNSRFYLNRFPLLQSGRQRFSASFKLHRIGLIPLRLELIVT